MIRLFLAAFIASGAFITSAIAQAPNQPRLKSEAIIHGDIVRIGDLIENSGVVANVPIFRAPDLGYTGTVSVDAVLNAIRDHALIGIDTAGLSKVVVTRATRTVPATDIEDLIARTLSARFDLGDSKDITVNLGHDMRSIYVDPLAVGEPRVAHIDYDTRSTRFDATIEIPAGPAKRSVLRVAGRAIPDRRSCDDRKDSRARQHHKRRGHRDGAASAQRGRPGRHHQTRRRYRHGSARNDAGWPPVASRGSDEARPCLAQSRP